MDLLTLILVIVAVGVLLYLIDRFVPMEAGTKTLLKIAVVVILVLWIVMHTGLLEPLRKVKV